MKRRPLTDDEQAMVNAEIKHMLHASRDALRNRGVDTGHVRFDVNDAYYGEAHGILRAIRLLCGPSDDDRGWLGRLEREVLSEEHFGGNDQCDFCLEHFGRDGAGRVRR